MFCEILVLFQFLFYLLSEILLLIYEKIKLRNIMLNMKMI